MGIIESSRKIGEEEMRLQEMTIEQEAEKKPHFDARELISDSEWGEMLKDLEHDTSTNSSRDEGMAFDMAIIFPERIPEIQKFGFNMLNGTKIRNQEGKMLEYPPRGALRTKFEAPKPGRLEYLDLAFAANMKQIFPDGEVFQDLEGDARPYLDKTLELLKTRRPPFNHFGELVLGLAELKILLPESKPESLVTWEELIKYLEELEQRKLRVPLKDLVPRQEYLYVARCAKILFPNKMKNYEIKPEIWQKTKEWLESDRQEKNWYDLISFTASMQILAAEKVYVDKTGLHLVMQETHDFQEKTPSLPERRSY